MHESKERYIVDEMSLPSRVENCEGFPLIKNGINLRFQISAD